MLLEERQNQVVEQFCGRHRRLAVVQLGKADLAVGINEGLLIDQAHSLQGTDVERILRAAVPRPFAFEFPVRFFICRGLFSRYHLCFGQH